MPVQCTNFDNYLFLKRYDPHLSLPVAVVYKFLEIDNVRFGVSFMWNDRELPQLHLHRLLRIVEKKFFLFWVITSQLFSTLLNCLHFRWPISRNRSKRQTIHLRLNYDLVGLYFPNIFEPLIYSWFKISRYQNQKDVVGFARSAYHVASLSKGKLSTCIIFVPDTLYKCTVKYSQYCLPI